MSDLRQLLTALVASLREAGVSHYEGWVPGWPGGTSVKLIVSPPAPTASIDKPRPRRQPLTPAQREEALDRAIEAHLNLHTGDPPPEAS
jgi:hypothetical protein